MTTISTLNLTLSAQEGIRIAGMKRRDALAVVSFKER